MKKIVVLHGTNYWNLGDLGLMIALLQSLNREIENPQIKILSLFTEREKPLDQKIDLSIYNAVEVPFFNISGKSSKVLRFSSFLFDFFSSILFCYSKKFFKNKGFFFGRKKIKEALTHLDEADLVISKPGGFLYSYLDAQLLLASPYWFAQIYISTFFDTPVMIYAQSIGPFKGAVSRFIARKTLSRVESITVREKYSYEGNVV